MVATISVLAGTASGVAEYYTHDGATDYYLAERNGVWAGSGAAALGLCGEVGRREFAHVLAGQTVSGKPLRRQSRGSDSNSGNQKRSCPGYDVTFSVPKSVSIYWSLATPKTRLQIETAILEAVKSTLEMLEDTVPLARRGKGGTERLAGKATAALFLHLTNRDLEQQCHVHAVIGNCLLGSDDQWSAVNSRLLHHWTPALGRVFRCELAQNLMRSFGVRLYRPLKEDGSEVSWFEIKGIHRQLIDACSSRRKAIEAALDGEALGLGASDARARQRANLKTRRQKPPQMMLSELFPKWRALAEQNGLGAEAVEGLGGKRFKSPKLDVYAKAFSTALTEITENEAHFADRDVVLRVAEKLQHLGFSGPWIAKEVCEDLQSRPEIVRLGEVAGEQRYTTQEMWDLEESLLSDVEVLRDRSGAVVTDETIGAILKERPELHDEQAKAAMELTTQPGSIRLLAGVAGAGKSYTLDTVREGFERSGYHVIGGALAGAAKEELVRQTSIDSRTIASYLYHLDRPWPARVTDRIGHDLKQIVRTARGKRTYALDRPQLTNKHVLVLDEIGMVGTRMLARIVEQVKRAGATLILCGDPSQLNPIEAGAPANAIARRVAPSRLDTNRRQQEVSDRRAVNLIRKGESMAALKEYSRRGLVEVGADREDAIQRLISTWSLAGGKSTPKDHVVFTQTRAEAMLVNRLCQHERLKHVRASQRRQFLKVGKTRYHVGDRVLFNQPYRQRFVENGYRGTVSGVSKVTGKITIRLDVEPSEKNRRRGASRVLKLTRQEMKSADVSLGFAATTHKLQGQTVKHSYLLLCSGMTSREMAYTQATRGSNSTTIFSDAMTAGEDLQGLSKAMRRSRAKSLAHDVKRQTETSRASEKERSLNMD